MVSQLNRRVLLATSTASMLGGCSQLWYEVFFSVESAATEALVNAIDAFMDQRGYSPVGSPDGLDCIYSGFWSDFEMMERRPGKFLAYFRYRTDLWLLFLPGKPNLHETLDAFIQNIASVEGVRIEGSINDNR